MTTSTNNSFTVTVKKEITDDLVRDLLCSAFEGGSNYWYSMLDLANSASRFAEFNPGGHKRPEGIDGCWHWPYIAPFIKGEGVCFTDNESGKVYTVNRDTIEIALQVMAEKYPKHFADFLNESGDADTGDVFLQCLALGEVQYS